MVNDTSNNFWPHYEYSKFFETDKFVWHYQLIGKPGNPIMLLIHGAGASSHSWASLIPKLQEFQILAVDLPGHRFSKIKKGINAYINLAKIKQFVLPSFGNKKRVVS